MCEVKSIKKVVDDNKIVLEIQGYPEEMIDMFIETLLDDFDEEDFELPFEDDTEDEIVEQVLILSDRNRDLQITVEKLKTTVKQLAGLVAEIN